MPITDPLTIILLGATLVACLATLVVGILRWTGRLKRWADPMRPDLPSIAVAGRSPLALIALGGSMLPILAAPFTALLSHGIAMWTMLTLSLPLFAFFLVLRFVQPGWSEPPWIAAHDWEHWRVKETERQGPRPER